MKTKIEWTKNADGTQGESWNPLRCMTIDGNPNVSKSGHFGTGCTMVSEGCLHCYASDMNYRFYGNMYGYHSKPTEFILDDKILNRPVRARKPTTFFVCSMTDLFHEGVPGELINQMWLIMNREECRKHRFIILTKRPERMKAWTHMKARATAWPIEDIWYPHIWLGTTAENQEQANIRIPKLLEIPAAIHWVSVEPMLGPVILERYLFASGVDGEPAPRNEPHTPRLDWVVCGGESGPKARPIHPDWAISLRDQCMILGTPFFFKQWGEWGPTIRDRQPVSVVEPHRGELAPFTTVACTDRKSIGQRRYHAIPETFTGPMVEYDILEKVGKKAAGRILDGRTWDEMPEVKK